VKSDDDVFPVVGGVARVLPNEHKVRLETAANNETRAIHRTLDVTEKCSLDGGPPNSCGQSFVANDRSFVRKQRTNRLLTSEHVELFLNYGTFSRISNTRTRNNFGDRAFGCSDATLIKLIIIAAATDNVSR